MGAHGTWQQTGGGGFDPAPLLIIIGAVLVAGPVMAAVAELLHLLVIVLVAAVAVMVVAAAGIIAWRWRHRGTPPRRPAWQELPRPMPARPVQPRTERPAIEQRQVHLHFHGVTAEQVASVIREQGDTLPPRVRE